MNTQQQQVSPTDWNSIVADNIRAEMSRQRWTGRKIASALGLTPAWVNRRTSGTSTLDPNDIKLFADFLGVEIADLFNAKKAPTPKGEGLKLLELDSNQQPAGIKPGDAEIIPFPARAEAVEADADAPLAPVTALFGGAA